MTTDADLAAQAVAELKLTTVGFVNKSWKTPPPSSHWAKALALLAEVGAGVAAVSAPIGPVKPS